MRRWSVRILLGLVVLILLAVLIVQLVLWSSIPRDQVVRQVQQQLGLAVEAAAVEAGWLGSTVLRDVVISLPLADESLLSVPELVVRHATLFELAIGQPLALNELVLRSPVLIVRQEPDGAWNVQEAVRLITQATARRAPPQRTAAPDLPEIIIENGTVLVVDRAGRQARIASMQFHGEPTDGLAWSYAASVPQQLQIEGELLPGGTWAHTATVAASNVGPWLEPWLPQPPPLALESRWTGQLQEGQLVGRLRADPLQIGDYRAVGTVDVRAGEGELVVEPEGLLLQTPQRLIPEIQLVSGAVQVAGEELIVDDLRARAVGGGVTLVEGRWNRTRNDATFNATWENVELPEAVRQSGSITATFTTPLAGNPQLRAQLVSSGQTPLGQWQTEFELTGTGKTWRNADLRIEAEQLGWEGSGVAFDTKDLTALLALRDDTLELTELRIAGEGTATGEGAIDLASLEWWLWLEANGWNVGGDSDIGFSVNAAGDREVVRLKELFLHRGDLTATGSGIYSFGRAEPVDLELNLRHLPLPDGDEDDPLLRGRLLAEAHLTGTARPLRLNLGGRLVGQEVVIGDRTLGEVAVQLDGAITPDLATFQTTRLSALGGSWSLSGRYLPDEEDIVLNVDVQDLPLSEVGDAANVPRLGGTLDGTWTFTADAPDQLTRDALAMTGQFEVEDLAVDQFVADRAAGEVSLRQGILRLEPLRLELDAGSATIATAINLRDSQRARVEIDADQWPLELEGSPGALRVTGEANLNVNAAENQITGPLNLMMSVLLGGEPLGEARLRAELEGQSIRIPLDGFAAELLGGTAEGAGVINLDELLETQARLEWDGIDGQAIAALFPQIDGLVGEFSGSIVVAPAEEDRPLEPLRVVLELDPSPETRFRAIEIGTGRYAGYIGGNFDAPDTAERRWRLVLSDISQELTEGGLVTGFLRVGQQRGRALSSQVILNFNDLSLNELVHAGRPDAEPMPGRIGGNITLMGDPREPEQLTGEGHLTIRQADLANSDIIGTLYDVLNLVIRSPDPTGEGRAELRLEQNTLFVPDFRYFNRGVEARGVFTVTDFWDIPDSPLEGYISGSARPLRELKLPLVADAEKIFSALQKSVLTLPVSGTVRDAEVSRVPVPLMEVGATVRRLLFGDVTR